MLPLLWKANNLKESEMTLINMPVPAMVPSLLQGQVDAILGSMDAYQLQLEAQGAELTNFRFADYGASGLFDTVKVGEAELERLYQFDLSVFDDLGQLEGQAAALPAPGGEDPAGPLDQLQQGVRALEERWKGRRQVLEAVAPQNLQDPQT